MVKGCTRVLSSVPDLTLSDADLNGVALVIPQGANARGRIRFDAPVPPAGVAPSQVIVEVMPPSGEAMSRYTGPNTARPDWTFEITGAVGRQLLYAGTIGPWQLKSVRLNGRDITDTPLYFGDGDVDGLEVLLTDRTPALSGRVTDSRGQTVIDATVVVFADNREKWGPRSRYIRSGRPDQQGRFTIEGLPPGQYLAIALDSLEPGEEQNPDLLEEWRSAAATITLAEGDARTLDLRLSTF